MGLQDVFIVGAKRTPFGNFGGKLKGHTATQLCTEASKAALASANVNPEIVDSVFVGSVAQTSVDAPYISRHVQLHAGIPQEKPALTVNRLCGSGFQSVVNGVQEIQLGESNVVLCGGAESMSQAPYSVYGDKARFGVPLGVGMNLTDTLWSSLTDKYADVAMGVTAENLAEKYGITRLECDEYAISSQERWQKAYEKGEFTNEIAPLELKSRKGVEIMDRDESPRTPDLAKLQKLPTTFKRDGTVTAGNASGIADGAGAVVVAGANAVTEHGLKPLARVVSYGIVGVEPTIMGIGPVPAIQAALDRAGLTIDDMDIIDINEAFAAQYLACEKELQLDRSKTNIMGGSIALGHPLGATGSRIMANLSHYLGRNPDKKYALGAACIGGGQGIAIIIENTSS